MGVSNIEEHSLQPNFRPRCLCNKTRPCLTVFIPRVRPVVNVVMSERYMNDGMIGALRVLWHDFDVVDPPFPFVINNHVVRDIVPTLNNSVNQR